jgi:hypothetical protein
MASRASAGGAAGASGVGFQDRIAAVFAAYLLAEKPLPGGLVPGVAVQVGGQTGLPVDDIALRTDHDGFLLVQAKAAMTLDTGPAGALGTAVQQVVAQFFYDGLPDRGGMRRLDPARDAIAVFTDAAASSSVRVALAGAIRRVASHPPGTPLDFDLNVAQAKAMVVLLAHIRRCWRDLCGIEASVEDIRGVLSVLHVRVLDADDGGPDQVAALASLSTVMPLGQVAAAWALLLADLHLASERRQWRSRDDLYRTLTNAGIRFNSTRLDIGSVAADARNRAQPSHSAYHHQVQSIAPTTLAERDSELAELAAFATDPDGPRYQWWRAPAWSGKSALMSWLVLHPPPGVAVISFFVTARLGGQQDRGAFVEVVLEQLADLLAVEMPQFLTKANQEAHLIDYLVRGADRCQRDGRLLLLVVDGLDEDQGWTADPDAHSIAALLPARPHPALRIVVASRVDPPLPADVSLDHPLRDPGVLWSLTPSPYAHVRQVDAERDVRRLLSGSPMQQQLLGLVTVAGGGLSSADLAELIGGGPLEVDGELKAVTGRAFQTRRGQWRPATRLFLLAHEQLQELAIGYLGPSRLQGYRRRLRAWADDYRDQRWPANTPEFLLQGYGAMLHDAGDVAALVALVGDVDRQERMRLLTGGDSAALVEIAGAQEVVAAGGTIDLAAMARLAVRRDRIRQRNTDVPVSLIVVRALLGEFTRAEALATSIPDPGDRTHALGALVDAALQMEDLDTAERLAANLVDTGAGVSPLLRTATAVFRSGDHTRGRGLFSRVQAVAGQIVEPLHCERTYVQLAVAAAQLEDPAGCESLARHAEDIIRTLEAPFPRRQELMLLADAMARSGNIEVAERLTFDVEQDYDRILQLCRLAEAAVGQADPARLRGYVAQAAALCGAIDLPRSHARALCMTAMATARVGMLENAAALAGSAAESARRVVEPGERVSALQWAAQALHMAGVSAGAAALTREAEAVAQTIDEAEQRSSALRAAAGAAALVDAEWAEAVVATIPVERQRDYALEDLVHAASRDDLGRAARLASEIGEPFARAQAQAGVALRLAEAGLLGQAAELADHAESTARAIVNADVELMSLTDLTTTMVELGDQARAAAFAEQLERYALVVLTDGLGPRSWRATAEALVGAGNLDGVSHLSALAPHGTEDARLVVAVVRALLRFGHVGRAEELAFRVAGPLLRLETLTLIAGYWRGCGSLDQARTFTRAAEETAATIPQPVERAAAAVSVVDALSGLGEFVEAEVLARSITEPAFRAGALTTLASRLMHAGRPGAATSILTAAQTAAAEIAEQHRRVDVLIDMAVAAAACSTDLSGPLLDAAEQASRSDPSGRPQLLARVAVGAARVGLIDRADVLAREDLSPSWDSHARTLAEVAEAMAGAGEADRAVTLVFAIRGNWAPRVQARIVKVLITALGVARTSRLAREISDPDLQAKVLAAAAVAADTPSNARRLVAEALSLGGWPHSVLALGHIDPAAATVLADDIVELSSRPDAATTLLRAASSRPKLTLDDE